MKSKEVGAAAAIMALSLAYLGLARALGVEVSQIVVVGAFVISAIIALALLVEGWLHQSEEYNLSFGGSLVILNVIFFWLEPSWTTVPVFVNAGIFLALAMYHLDGVVWHRAKAQGAIPQ